MRHELNVRFCIWDFEDISHEKITELIGYLPSKIYIKEQKKNMNFSATSKTNGWILDAPHCDRFSTFEEQIDSLLDVIEAKMETFKKICSMYPCELSCAIYIRFDNGESIPSVHLDGRYHKIASDLGIELDVDLYCLPNG